MSINSVFLNHRRHVHAGDIEPNVLMTDDTEQY